MTMKKVLFVLATCLLIASCGTIKRTVDINSIKFDTLRVGVLIFDGDTLKHTISYDKTNIIKE